MLAQLVINSSQEERTLMEIFGWNAPAINKHGLAAMSSSIANKIKEVADIPVIESELLETLESIPNKINTLISQQVVAHMFDGNHVQAVPVYVMTLESIKSTLTPLFSWQYIDDSNSLIPPRMANRLASIDASINQLVPDIEVLESKVSRILEASSAAESLPITMQTLSETTKKIQKIKDLTHSNFTTTEIKLEEITKTASDVNGHFLETQNLLQKCQEAYSIATTIGLAASFDQRAKKLNLSVRLWVANLFIALSAGSWIGYQRIEMISSILKDNSIKIEIIFIHIALAIFSLGAPLWFAWLATKKIGQNSKLAEDYSFKASVAKAYEGYRKEAVRIDTESRDTEFEKRLFDTALTRLEEAPLRLVNDKNHSSPMHEIVDSDVFKSFIPEFMGLLKSAFSTFAMHKKQDESEHNTKKNNKANQIEKSENEN